MAEPRCPDCGTVGMDKLVTSDSKEHGKDGKPWFNVVHCDECGHVYGVFAKHVYGGKTGTRLVIEGRG